MSVRRVVVLGITGSIGAAALKLLRRFPDRFLLVGASGHRQTEYARALAREFSLSDITMTGSCSEQEGRARIKRLLSSCEAEVVVNGIAGAAGLFASLEVLKTRCTLALANKESVVLAASLLHAAARESGATIVPVDSEHAAIFQLIAAHGAHAVAQVVLTASGGPFRTFSKECLAHVTVEDALQHPTWRMGKKISVNSATLANKALEVIEAVQFFRIPVDRVTVVVHPQSIVHALVQCHSGETYAQLSVPDMASPLLYALLYPDAPPAYQTPLDFTSGLSLHFEPPRVDDFPLLRMGFDVARAQRAYPIAFNAANEEAVRAFLQRNIGFLDIAHVTAQALQEDWRAIPQTFEEVMACDTRARMCARTCIAQRWRER